MSTTSLESLITTKFASYDYWELFELVKEFEEKLTNFEENNPDCKWDIQIYFGEVEHTIIVIVKNEDKD